MTQRLIVLLLCAWFSLSAQTTPPPTSLVVMSYNIRFNNPQDGPNAWPQRKDLLTRQIRFHQPDIIGMQEVLQGQLDTLAERLPRHAWVGVGRDDGRMAGEFAPVFYRTDRFELADWGTFWLSESPDQVSTGWDAALPRICTWLRLREKTSGQVILVANTHFDHVGEKARRESVRLIHRRLAALNPDDLPVIITGDFNLTPEKEAIRFLQSNYLDAWINSRVPTYGPVGTYNGFQADHPLDGRIDYIFCSPDHWQVYRVAHLSTLRQGRYPSDHLPVVAELRLRP